MSERAAWGKPEPTGSSSATRAERSRSHGRRAAALSTTPPRSSARRIYTRRRPAPTRCSRTRTEPRLRPTRSAPTPISALRTAIRRPLIGSRRGPPTSHPPWSGRSRHLGRAARLVSEQRQASGVDRTNTSRDREVTGRFRAVLDAGPNAVVGTDTAGIIVYANEHLESMFGYQVGSLVGQPIEDLIPEAAVARHVGRRERYANTGGPRHERRTGTRRTPHRRELLSRRGHAHTIETNEACRSRDRRRHLGPQGAAGAASTARSSVDRPPRRGSPTTSTTCSSRSRATRRSSPTSGPRRADLDSDEPSERHTISLAAERAANLTAQLLASSRTRS